MKSKEILELAQKYKSQVVELKFTNLIGQPQTVSLPLSELTEQVFQEGVSIHSAAMTGSLNSKDILLFPDPTTAFINPCLEELPLSLISNVADPITKESFSQDPRFVARKAEGYLKTTGLGDQAFFAPELDSVLWGAEHEDTAEAPFRSEIMSLCEKVGVLVTSYRFVKGEVGRLTVGLHRQPLLKMADSFLMTKYVIRSVARKYGKKITFLPKPFFADQGSGMTLHTSLWRSGKALFAGTRYAGLSESGLHFMGGILKHGRALSAFTNPLTNSYRRLLPESGAPIYLTYSSTNRSTAIYVPAHATESERRRVEIQFPDPAANPYLAFSAILMAGIDGIQNRIEPGEPFDKDEKVKSPDLARLPETLEEALEALEEDNAFLMRGDVFTQDLITRWIQEKRECDIAALHAHPTPHELSTYFDI